MDFHMNGGEGDTSYADNSLPQRSNMFKTKPILDEAVQQLFCSTCVAKIPNTMSIADLGCSFGANSFLPLMMVLDAVDDICARSSIQSPAEFQVFLNDLPGNDFNTLFKAVPAFYESLQGTNKKSHDHQLGSPCYISGTPGSFYGRLFPARTMHFVHSANSLHWLSQAPPGLTDEAGDHNKGNIALSRSSSPGVFEAYLKQFQRDFTGFLRSRSVETVSGGRMVLSFMGRKIADPFDQDCDHFWDDLAHALRDLVAEGIVGEAEMSSFNVPYYEPHIEEVRKIIDEEGSFEITRLEEVHRDNSESNEENHVINRDMVVNCNRAIAEPMVAKIVEKLFERFEERLSWGDGSKVKVFLVVSLTRKDRKI